MNLADVSCKLAKLFVSAGADLNALNKEGQTPLMVAVLQVYTSFVLCYIAAELSLPDNC